MPKCEKLKVWGNRNWQFNPLNILLSFAQFEREVIGERIRDKFSASKRKGIWMGGVTPLGYVVKERQLLIEESKAKSVRQIFERFLMIRLGRHFGSGIAKIRDYQQTATHKKRQNHWRKYALCKPSIYKMLSNPVLKYGGFLSTMLPSPDVAFARCCLRPMLPSPDVAFA